MGRINLEIPDDLHQRLRMIASGQGKGFYEWLKEDLTASCPDERTLLEILEDIRRERARER